MDVRQLTYFLAIVEHQHFGRAADDLHIAQPSLSQAIRTLERELGTPLFHRVGRGIVLSDAGTQLVEPARQVLRDLDAAKDAVKSVQGLQRGRVELVTMPGPGMEPLSTIMSDFTRRHPAMSVTADAAFTADEVLHAVRTGRSELGLAGAASVPSTVGLQIRPIEEQPLVLLSPPEGGHPMTMMDRAEQAGRNRHRSGTASLAATVVQRSELDGMRLVVSKRGSLMRQFVEDVLASGVAADIAAEVEHRTSILSMVVAGVGHAVVPKSWSRLAIRAGVQVRALEPGSVLHIVLVSRPGSLTPAAQAFTACVEAYVERASRAT